MVFFEQFLKGKPDIIVLQPQIYLQNPGSKLGQSHKLSVEGFHGSILKDCPDPFP